ncbi:MAG TPA: hypothetical protein VIJ95_13435 [Hanamia sp.]
MKATLQQEILIITGTSFLSRLSWQNIEDTNQIYSETEQLQEACWNGMLPEMLPEICLQFGEKEKLYLWNVKENKSSIEIDICDAPCAIEKDFSIDPYAFLSVQLMN